MDFPILTPIPAVRDTTDVFRGYDRRSRTGAGAFSDMRNLSPRNYPALSPRKGRAVHRTLEAPGGLIAKDALCWVDGSNFVINDYPVNLGLTEGPKQLISMGAKVIILPDKKWINTLDVSQYGSLEAGFASRSPVSVTLCALDGGAYENYPLGDTPPEAPENGQLWMDTATRPHVLKKYAAQSETWTAVPSTYLKLYSPGLGAAFRQYDAVTITGAREESLNGTFVLWDRGEDWILIPGILDEALEEPQLTIERRMPEMDLVIESGNRLWGCRYGISAQGQVVNEIYASKLGDPTNWQCFMGLSTDSFTASCGTDGPFTGAVCYLGWPLFFKEMCLHKVYGQIPANFQIQTIALRGVEQGSGKSLCQVGEVLYYKSTAGVCAYDGSLPRIVSQALGTEAFRNAVSGTDGEKLYISMEGPALLVFDPGRDLWHREDDLAVQDFCFCRGRLYALSGKTILTLDGGDETVSWMGVTGHLGLTDPKQRFLTRLTLRLTLPFGSRMRIFVRYDGDGPWESLACLQGRGQPRFSIPLRPRRCSHCQLKLEGEGDFTLYSLTQTLEGGES